MGDWQSVTRFAMMKKQHTRRGNLKSSFSAIFKNGINIQQIATSDCLLAIAEDFLNALKRPAVETAGRLLCGSAFKLAVIQRRVETALCQQFLVIAAFHHIAVFQHQN